MKRKFLLQLFVNNDLGKLMNESWATNSELK